MSEANETDGTESHSPTPLRHVKQSGLASGELQLVVCSPTIFHPEQADYMMSANCLARDFYSSQFVAFCKSLREPPYLHRKQWEFAFIAEHLRRTGVLVAGAKGIGFGVGTEPMPALFASMGCTVLATDAPPGVADKGWSDTTQWSDSIEPLCRPDMIDDTLLKERVKFDFCNMASIGDGFKDQFDFCWSACCFEHLGSLQAGFDFVIESVERTLRVGGVACHTSELNLSSNNKTLETGGTVLYRRRDIEALRSMLEDRGHEVSPLPLTPGLAFVDHLVDVPPYSGDVHLKKSVGGFVTTSFGIVVRRGR